MLKFIGSGSAFNTNLGNTSAYIKKDDKLLLIDCGELTFDGILKLNLMEGIKELHILITHTHSDHIGSLGSLILYSYYINGIRPTIYLPDFHFYKILGLMGVTSKHCYLKDATFINKITIPSMNIKLEYVPTVHCKEMNSYSIFINKDDEKTIFFSGDSYEINNIAFNFLEERKIDYFYQDTCKADYPDNVHLSLNKLVESVPKQFRSKIYCMHLDNTFSKEEAKQFGFNVVENEK